MLIMGQLIEMIVASSLQQLLLEAVVLMLPRALYVKLQPRYHPELCLSCVQFCCGAT